jgi:hypothetical protein
VNNEPLSEGRVPMQNRFLDPQQDDIRDARGARDPTRLASETSLPKEVTDPEHADDRRLSAMRQHCQLDPPD